MPSLLFIDHSYHKKTSSSVFMQQLLGTRYDITVFSFDPYSDGVDIYCGLQQIKELHGMIQIPENL